MQQNQQQIPLKLSNVGKAKFTKFILRISISLVILIAVLNIVDWQMVLQELKSAQPFYIAAAFIAVKLCIFISALKWHYILNQTHTLPFGRIWRWYYIGFYFNNFLPGSIGGDILRVYYAGKESSYSQAIASVTVERLFAGIALIMTACFGFLLANLSEQYWLHLACFSVVCLIIYLVLFNQAVHIKLKQLAPQKWQEKLGQFFDVLSKYKENKAFFWILMGYSLAFQLCFVWMTDLLFRAFGVDVSFAVQLAFVSLISALTMLPLSINGLGVREGAYAYLFSTVGVAVSLSVAVSLLFFFLVLIATAMGGIFWMYSKEEAPKINV